MSKQKKKPAPKVVSMKDRAAEARKSLAPAAWQAIKAKFPNPDLVEGTLSAIAESDVTKLQRQLAVEEKCCKSAAELYAELWQEGVDALEDWEVSGSGNVGAQLERGLIEWKGKLALGRGHVASLKARLAELQGALVPVALKETPTEKPDDKKRKTESLRDLEWLSVRRRVLEACLSCAAKADTRYYLNGVFLHSLKGELRVAATNGHTLLAHTTAMKSAELPDWLTAGLILPRDELAIALAALAKVTVGEDAIESVQIGFGANHQHVIVRDAGQFATFRFKPTEGKFPDYTKVLADAGQVLEGGEREALSASSIDREYVKQASAVAAKFDAKGITPYIGHSASSPIVVTFSGEPGALLIVMPITTAPELQMPAPALAMMSKGLAGTASALKAHLTRQKQALSKAGSDADKATAAGAIARLEARLRSVAAAMGGKLIEGPKAKVEPKPAAKSAEAGAAVH